MRSDANMQVELKTFDMGKEGPRDGDQVQQCGVKVEIPKQLAIELAKSHLSKLDLTLSVGRAAARPSTSPSRPPIISGDFNTLTFRCLGPT